MARETISFHEVRILEALQDHVGVWLTNREIANLVPGVAERTVRAYTRRWVQLGLLEEVALFPAPRYRLASMWPNSNHEHIRRLREAAAVFGGLSSAPGALVDGSEGIPALVARLDATRAAIGEDREQDDSTDLIRQAREERAGML